MPEISSDVIASPPQILRACLIDLNLVSFPQEQNEFWWCYVGSLASTPDEAVCIKKGAGRVFGRRSRDKKNLVHCGVTIIIRAKKYDVAFTKANAIMVAIDTQMTPIEVRLPVIEDEAQTLHTIQNVIRTSEVNHVGEELGTQRELFSITARIAFSDVESPLG